MAEMIACGSGPSVVEHVGDAGDGGEVVRREGHDGREVWVGRVEIWCVGWRLGSDGPWM